VSAPRKPARETYDAEIRFDGPLGQQLPRLYVKMSWQVLPDGLRPGPALALRAPIHEGKGPVTFVPGTDYWPFKLLTDVAVIGYAFTPDGKPAIEMRVAAQVGRRVKRAQVTGQRYARLSRRSGTPVFSKPEPFTRMALNCENAYGGVDARVDPGATDETRLLRWGMGLDHPGAYARNPFGRGYVVGGMPAGELIALPTVEAPFDLLTPERLVLADPAQWHLQPLAWCYDWMHTRMFPRLLYFRRMAAPWFPPPPGEELAEQRLKLMAIDLEEWRAEPPDDEDPLGTHPMFVQEASLGLSSDEVKEGCPIRLRGMHPAGRNVDFTVPPPPHVDVAVERMRSQPELTLTSVECLPADDLVTMTYAADLELPRALIPGIHKEIDIRASINGDQPIAYEPPPTVFEQAGMKFA
jgi:hypothetical protein